MHDALGDRMKSAYENRTRYFLPRRSYTIIRLDGKGWHNYTRKLEKPFDLKLIEDINRSVIEILPEIQGAVFAYCQSDEISILLTDFEKPTTAAWFDGNIQKISSISASLMTAYFNQYRFLRELDKRIGVCLAYTDFPKAMFDSRCFTIPDPTEVYNYFVFRNNDSARNSINMVAQSIFSHNELQNKSCSQIHEMLYQKNINWAEFPEELKNGRLIVKEEKEEKLVVYPEDKNKPPYMDTVLRKNWIIKPAWVFTKNPEPLKALIPKYE